MSLRIETDLARFRKIIRGRVRKDLKHYITHSDLIGKPGRDSVRLPISKIRIPHFCFDPLKQGGIGQGDGNFGQPDEKEKIRQSQPGGNAPGNHQLEAEFSLKELARMLGEELELPSIQPRGKHEIITERERYWGLRHSGPESLRVMKRTYRAALRRQIMSHSYDPENPVIIPIREDLRYRSWKERPVPESNALIIYMMDVSGSMGDEQKEIVRTEAFWIDTWLRSQYNTLQIRYVIHDAVAREVDEKTFYRSKESGGTIISSAYQLALEIIEEQYNPFDWNIYLFHFSDGDNWGEMDTQECVELLTNELLPRVNLFCYGQVESHYGSGQFIEDLKMHFSHHEKIVFSEIANKDAIYHSIKQFLGKGK